MLALHSVHEDRTDHSTPAYYSNFFHDYLPGSRSCPLNDSLIEAAQFNCLNSQTALTGQAALEVTIEDVFEELLATAFVLVCFALLADVLIEGLEGGFTGFDFFADPCVPASVSVFDEVREDPIFANIGSDS